MSLDLKWISYKEYIVLFFFFFNPLYQSAFDWYILTGFIDINIITLEIKFAILFFHLFP